MLGGHDPGLRELGREIKTVSDRVWGQRSQVSTRSGSSAHSWQASIVSSFRWQY